MLYILLGLLGGTLVLLLLFADNGQIFGFDADKFATVGATAALLLYLSGGFIHRGMTLSKGLNMALIWVALGAVLFLGYQFYNG